jgi:hypothetical protein
MALKKCFGLCNLQQQNKLGKYNIEGGNEGIIGYEIVSLS